MSIHANNSCRIMTILLVLCVANSIAMTEPTFKTQSEEDTHLSKASTDNVTIEKSSEDWELNTGSDAQFSDAFVDHVTFGNSSGGYETTTGSDAQFPEGSTDSVTIESGSEGWETTTGSDAQFPEASIDSVTIEGRSEGWKTTTGSDAQFPESSTDNVLTGNSSEEGRVILETTTGSARSTCLDVEETWVAGSGNIAFRERPEDCSTRWTWTIKPPNANLGIVAQFIDVSLRQDSSLMMHIYSVYTPPLRVFTNDTGFNDIRPLYVPSGDLILVLRTPYSNNKLTLTVLNISITTQNSFIVLRRYRLLNSGTFKCSGQNASVPPTFLCNGIRECLYGEDERGCDPNGCGEGWASFRHQCILVNVVSEIVRVPGHSLSTDPFVVDKTCKYKHNGELALLMDAEGIQFLEHLLRKMIKRTYTIGLRKTKPVSQKLRHLYRYTWQWGNKGSPVSYDAEKLGIDVSPFTCAVITAPPLKMTAVRCLVSDSAHIGYVCTKRNPLRPDPRAEKLIAFHFQDPGQPIHNLLTKKCPDGSLVQTFHDCLGKWEGAVRYSIHDFPDFVCRFGPPVHHSLVCDGLEDCADGSDEMDCARVQFPPLLNSMFQCDNKQLVPTVLRCNGQPDCFDESDEVDCTSCTQGIMCNGVGCVPRRYNQYFKNCQSTIKEYRRPQRDYGPMVKMLDGYGMTFTARVDDYNITGIFPCKGGRYIASYLVNNGELDCPYGDDENIPAENLTCPGFYRCHHTSMCVHPDFVCDDIIHCPNKDDERYCNLVCPDGCVCEGYAYSCSKFEGVYAFVHARYLDLSNTDLISVIDLHFIENLKFLNLSHCKIYNMSIDTMSHLGILDVSFNNITDLASLRIRNLHGLRYLNISGNPLSSVLNSEILSFATSSGLGFLEHLTMQTMGLSSLEDKALSSFTALRVLDITDNPIELYGKEVFHGLSSLEVLYTDESKLCCPYFHMVSLKQCFAPFDELSSCDDLLGLDFYRVFLWLFAVLAITGNSAVLLYRLCAKTQATSKPFRVLVTNLCLSDLFMGLYLMIVGVADSLFRGHYVSEGKAWTESIPCKIAGFLGFVSSEVSALMICLITFDRLLVVQFPLKANLHMGARSAAIISGGVWLLGIMMASLPLLADLEFYGETGICLPLPITRRQYSGQWYAFGVFIVLNFVLFCLVGGCQALIYCTVRSVGRDAGSGRRSRDLLIARRLFLIAFTDFCCWFPVGIMGLMAANGFPIPDSITVTTAVFFLPINSALNPFLYTINSILQKREAHKVMIKAKKILGNFQKELSRLQPDMAEEIIRGCVRSRAVSRDKMLQWLQLSQDSVNGFHCEGNTPSSLMPEKSEK